MSTTAPAPAPAPAASNTAERLRILITDDDPIQRAFGSAFLGKTAGSVDTAESGEEGLKKLAANAYDIALLDLDMPGMGGFETLKAIRANPSTRRLPVIIVTSREDVASIDKAYGLGASSFAIKPVNWTLLSYQMRYVVREATSR